MDKPSLTVESTPRVSQSPSDDATAADPFRHGSVHRLVIFRLENQRYALHLTASRAGFTHGCGIAFAQGPGHRPRGHQFSRPSHSCP